MRLKSICFYNPTDKPFPHPSLLLTYLVSRPKDLGDDELFCWKTEQKPHDTQTQIHKHWNFDSTSPRGLFLSKFQSTQDGLHVSHVEFEMW